MENSKFFRELKDSEYGEGIMLDEYQGSWSLVSANKKKDTIYLQWVFPQKRDGSKKPMDKALPWKVKIGKDKEEAIQTLTYMLGLLGGNTSESEPF